MCEQSKLIYTGRFNDKYTETNFRLADNIILITDLRDTKIITLYKIEYGFDRETSFCYKNGEKVILDEQYPQEFWDLVLKEFQKMLNVIDFEKHSLAIMYWY